MESGTGAEQGICTFLRRIAELLEGGDATEAARIVAEMELALPAMSVEVSDGEVSEAERLLERCRNLEQGLRERALESMRQLGAARKSAAYRQSGL